MISARPPRKPDFFAVVLWLVVLGLSATVAYQINLYAEKGDYPIARHAQQVPPAVGG